jgi:hypothetical protein
MTDKEFTNALAALSGKSDVVVSPIVRAQVLIAAGMVIQKRRGLIAGYIPTPLDLADFIKGLDRSRRRKLKSIADGVELTDMTTVSETVQ